MVADYRELKSLLEPLAPVAPVYIGLGNHDHRENFKQVFMSPMSADAAVPRHHVLVIEESFLRFVVLDSLFYVNKASRLLGHQQRGLRIPQVSLGDSDGDLLDADRLFAIIRPYRQVKAIFYGHSHTWQIGERQVVKLINLPALGYNFWKEEPVGWVDAHFCRTGVDRTLHAISGNRAQDGQTSRVIWG